jgi:hypothetical protein
VSIVTPTPKIVKPDWKYLENGTFSPMQALYTLLAKGVS